MDIDNFILFCLRRGRRVTFFRRNHRLFSYLLEIRQLKKARLQLGKISFLIRDEDPYQAVIFPKIRIHFVNQIIRNKPRQIFEKIFLGNRIRHPYLGMVVITLVVLFGSWTLGYDFATSVLRDQDWKTSLIAPFFDAIFDLSLFTHWMGSHSGGDYGMLLISILIR